MQLKLIKLFFLFVIVSSCTKNKTDSALLSDQYDVTTIAGNGTAGFADGAALQAQFNEPKGLSIDGSGNFIISEAIPPRIRKLSGNVVTTLIGTGCCPAGYQNGIFSIAKFSYPIDLFIESNGDILISDVYNDRIRRVSTSSVVSTVAGITQSPSEHLDGPVSIAKIPFPYGITKDQLGNIFCIDGNNRIRKLGTDGIVSTFVDNNAITDDWLFSCIAAFSDNYLVALSRDNVYLISPTGTVLHLAGGNLTSGYADGTGTNALFNHLTGVLIDAEGNIFVSDSYNNRIRKISKKK